MSRKPQDHLNCNLVTSKVGMCDAEKPCLICDALCVVASLRSTGPKKLSALSEALDLSKPRVQRALRILKRLGEAKFVDGEWR